jgi:hypothetical protein
MLTIEGLFMAKAANVEPINVKLASVKPANAKQCVLDEIITGKGGGIRLYRTVGDCCVYHIPNRVSTCLCESRMSLK